MNNDVMVEETQGLSRREMLIGAGILAAGYGVGQLATAERAHAAANIGFADMTINTGLPWPAAWADPVVFNPIRQQAAIRGFNQFRRGGG